MHMTAPLAISTRAQQTEEPPISYFMQQAVENPNLISLAAGLVDPASLPTDEVRAVVAEMLADADAGQDALQYGTTQGYAPLRDKVARHVRALDGLTPDD